MQTVGLMKSTTKEDLNMIRWISVWKNERGASMVEYALLVALIAVVAIVALTGIGQALAGKFQEVLNTLGN